jgi:hypothetical protein
MPTVPARPSLRMVPMYVGQCLRYGRDGRPPTTGLRPYLAPGPPHMTTFRTVMPGADRGASTFLATPKVSRSEKADRLPTGVDFFAVSVGAADTMADVSAERDVDRAEISTQVLHDALSAIARSRNDAATLSVTPGYDTQVVTFPNLAASAVLARADVYAASGSAAHGRLRYATWREGGGCVVVAYGFSSGSTSSAVADADALALICRLRLRVR